MASNPTLGAWGFVDRDHAEYGTSRQRLLESVPLLSRVVDRLQKWDDLAGKSAYEIANRISSELRGVIVPPGLVIAAARHLGLPFRRSDRGGYFDV